MYELEVFRWKYSFLGINLSLRGEHSKSVEFAEKQFDYLPDEGGGMGYLGWIHCLSGDPKRARTLLEQSLRLLSRPVWHILEWSGLAHLLCDCQDEALAVLGRACSLASDPSFPYALKSVAYIELGEPDHARSEMKQALSHRPELSLGHFRAISGIRNELSSISTCVERVARRFRLHGTCLNLRRDVEVADGEIDSCRQRAADV